MPYRKDDNTGSSQIRALKGGDEYTVVSGRIVLPVAEDPPTDPVALANWSPVVVIQLHPEYRIRNVQMTTSRERAPGLLPAPADSGRFKFLNGTLSFPKPVPNADDTSFTWSSSASLQFVEAASPSWYTGYVLTENPIMFGAEAKAVLNTSEGAVTSSGLRESTELPRYGEAIGKQVDHNQPGLGLSIYSGCYSIASYYPAQFFTAGAVAGDNTNT